MVIKSFPPKITSSDFLTDVAGKPEFQLLSECGIHYIKVHNRNSPRFCIICISTFTIHIRRFIPTYTLRRFAETALQAMQYAIRFVGTSQADTSLLLVPYISLQHTKTKPTFFSLLSCPRQSFSLQRSAHIRMPYISIHHKS